MLDWLWSLFASMGTDVAEGHPRWLVTSLFLGASAIVGLIVLIVVLIRG